MTQAERLIRNLCEERRLSLLEEERNGQDGPITQTFEDRLDPCDVIFPLIEDVRHLDGGPDDGRLAHRALPEMDRCCAKDIDHLFFQTV